MRVQLENVTLSYGDAIAIDNLDVTVADGESLVLLGKSGCGKTSTMRCIAGLETPTTIGDTVVFDSDRGIDVSPNKRNIGMVFQSYAVWPHRTIFQNVAFPLKQQKVPKGQIRDRVMEVLELVGLAEFASRGASMLSGGQMQRVALARSLVMRPSVLLLDEPLSNLDARLRDRLRVELREIQQQLNLTCVYVTHDQVEALALADRIALMQGGRIVQIDRPERIYDSPVSASIADFLGVTNTFPCAPVAASQQKFELVGHGIQVVSDRCDTESVGDTALTAEPTACIRPEDVRLSAEAGESETNTWLGRVEVVSFQGSSVRYKVGLKGGPEIDVLAPRNGDALLRIGDHVWASVDRAAVQVLPSGVSS